MSLVRVLEIGGTHVTAATVDADEHRVRERTRTALDSGASAAGILATLSGAAMSLADTVPTRWAVAIPDPFDYARGIGLFRDVGKFDALYGVDVGRALRDAITPRPQSITFTHDTEAFLLGEWLSGAAVGARRCAAVTLGTGVGSAFLDNGTTVRAGPGIPPDGRIHRLSVDGAPLEDTVSRRAIRARYAARAGKDLDVHEIAELARHGDPRCPRSARARLLRARAGAGAGDARLRSGRARDRRIHRPQLGSAHRSAGRRAGRGRGPERRHPAGAERGGLRGDRCGAPSRCCARRTARRASDARAM